jgi:hypothetical protein
MLVKQTSFPSVFITVSNSQWFRLIFPLPTGSLLHLGIVSGAQYVHNPVVSISFFWLNPCSLIIIFVPFMAFGSPCLLFVIFPTGTVFTSATSSGIATLV